MKHCLLYLLTPIGFTAAMSAVYSLALRDSEDDLRVTCFLYTPVVDQARGEEIMAILSTFSQGFPAVETMLHVSGRQKEAFFAHEALEQGIRDLKRFIGRDIFTEIYYSHDITGGEMIRLLCLAYPEARCICYGDGLGIVKNRELHLSLLHVHSGETIKTAQGWELGPFKTDTAALVLPIDQAGDFFEQVPLHVCEQEIVSDVLARCIDAAGELQRYLRELVERYARGNIYLLLTENMAEARYLGFDRDIDMYSTMVRQYVPSGSVVLVKGHPLEALPRGEGIQRKLKGEYDIVPLAKTYQRYPIETWKELLQRTSRIVCLTFPAISLRYLYGIEVVQPMDEVFIETWFDRWTWDSFKEFRRRLVTTLANLESWDRKSALYRGPSKGA
jgi:hypothetical protein